MARCNHPVKERVWKGDELVCTLCGTVLRTKPAPDPKDSETLFSDKPCEASEVCENASEVCGEEATTECFDAADIPTEESPFEEIPGGVEVEPESIPVAPETANVTEEGVSIGEVSQPFTRPLPVLVTPIQLGEFSLEQATLYRELKELEDKKKASAKAFSDRITKVECRLDELSKIVTEGTLETPIECQWQFFYSQGIKRLVRLDTHEIVDEKTLTSDEIEGSFDFEGTQSVAAVEEAFATEKTKPEDPPETDLLPGQCPVCRFKNGNHSPVCTNRPADEYALCQCGVCGAEATCIPYDKCQECGEGLMEPMESTEVLEDPT